MENEQHISFLDRLRAATVRCEDIDEYVQRWHDGEGGSMTLAQYLGFSDDEAYGRWMRDPTQLADIARGLPAP